MSTPPISPREFEQLSAYLDGQLDARAADQVKRDLHQRPELQRALDDLTRMHMLLRAVPRRRVPRNFTLKPEMVPARRRVSSRPVLSLGLASILATIFLVFSVLLEFVPEPMLSAVPAAPQAADSGTQLNQAEPTGSAEMKVAAATPEPTLAAREPSSTRKSAQPETEPPPGADLQPQATPLPPEQTDQPPQALMGAPPTAEPDAASAPGAAPLRSEARKTLTWLQTLLVVLALGTGLAALYLRRR